MRILLVGTTFYPNYFGGAETYLLDLAKELKRREHAVKVVCVESWSTPTEPGVPVKTLKGEHDGISTLRLFFDAATSGKRGGLVGHVSHAALVDSTIRSYRPDIIHITNASHQMEWARGADRHQVPFVVTAVDFGMSCMMNNLVHANLTLCDGSNGPAKCARCLGQWGNMSRVDAAVSVSRWTRLLPNPLRGLMWNTAGRLPKANKVAAFDRSTMAEVDATLAFWKWLHGRVGRVFAPSTIMRNVLIKSGFPEDKVEALVYGIDTSNFAPEPRWKEPSEGTLRLAYIGRFNKLKGIDTLLDAMALIPKSIPVTLSLYGDLELWNKGGKAYARAVQRAASRDSRIVLQGLLPRERISEAYAKHDVLVAPSRWYENSPISILEALHHGTPVIGSDMEGIAHIVRDRENGLLFPTGSPEGLALVIRELAQSPELLAKLRDGAQLLSGIEDHVTHLLGVYDGLLPVARG